MSVVDTAIKLSAQAVDVASSGHGLVGPVVELFLRNLVEVQDEQSTLLRKIDQNVQNLVDGPWRTARLHLGECLLPARTPEQVTESQRLAANYLREAVGISNGLGAAYAAFDLSVLLAAQGDLDASRFYARQSMASAGKAVIEVSTARKPMWKRSLEKEMIGVLLLTLFEKRPLEYREWLVLAASLGDLCGLDFMRQEMARFPQIARVDLYHDWDGIAEFGQLEKPSWLQHPWRPAS
ncbi:hypothetical protein ACIRG5_23830 [Lentzea sp. NPDC102401]|uniref:hypothetical protein n=1 Tax=Lentzea sp. NPDC102401 TaxID=3364128 RepID=UPI00381C0021